MKKEYVKPEIQVIEQIYNEGLLTTISLGISTTPTTNPGGIGAKPSGNWGDVWADPTVSSTTGTNSTGTTSPSSTDMWGAN